MHIWNWSPHSLLVLTSPFALAEQLANGYESRSLCAPVPALTWTVHSYLGIPKHALSCRALAVAEGELTKAGEQIAEYQKANQDLTAQAEECRQQVQVMSQFRQHCFHDALLPCGLLMQGSVSSLLTSGLVCFSTCCATQGACLSPSALTQHCESASRSLLHVACHHYQPPAMQTANGKGSSMKIAAWQITLCLCSLLVLICGYKPCCVSTYGLSIRLQAGL